MSLREYPACRRFRGWKVIGDVCTQATKVVMFKNLLVFDSCLFVARKAVPNWDSSFPCCYPASIFLSVNVYCRFGEV